MNHVEYITAHNKVKWYSVAYRSDWIAGQHENKLIHLIPSLQDSQQISVWLYMSLLTSRLIPYQYIFLASFPYWSSQRSFSNGSRLLSLVLEMCFLYFCCGNNIPEMYFRITDEFPLQRECDQRKTASTLMIVCFEAFIVGKKKTKWSEWNFQIHIKRIIFRMI